MDKKVTQFEVSSPAELQEALAQQKEFENKEFAAIRIFGPKVVTQYFHLPDSSTKDLASALKTEASETLSIQTNEIEITYEVTAVNEGGVYGIYSAISRLTLLEYLDCFKNTPLIPISLTASTIGAIDDFLKIQVPPSSNYCLVHFLKSHAVNIVVFSKSKPIFFRDLYDLNEDDFERKITDTIRYSCSRSSNKNINHIFFTGNTQARSLLMENIKKLETPLSGEEVSHDQLEQIDLSKLNLTSKYVLNLKERKGLLFNLSLLFTAVLFFNILLSWHFINGQKTLNETQLKTDLNLYTQAVNLQNQVKQMIHAK